MSILSILYLNNFGILYLNNYTRIIVGTSIEWIILNELNSGMAIRIRYPKSAGFSQSQQESGIGIRIQNPGFGLPIFLST